MNNVVPMENAMVRKEMRAMMEYLADRVNNRGVPEKVMIIALLSLAKQMEEIMDEEVNNGSA